MRRFLATLLVSAMLSVPAAAQEFRDISGLEWMEGSAGQRMERLLKSMTVMTKAGVKLTRTPHEYYDGLLQYLRRNPSIYTRDITNLLAEYVYESEPDNRPVLDALRKKV